MGLLARLYVLVHPLVGHCITTGCRISTCLLAVYAKRCIPPGDVTSVALVGGCVCMVRVIGVVADSAPCCVSVVSGGHKCGNRTMRRQAEELSPGQGTFPSEFWDHYLSRSKDLVFIMIF